MKKINKNRFYFYDIPASRAGMPTNIPSTSTPTEGEKTYGGKTASQLEQEHADGTILDNDINWRAYQADKEQEQATQVSEENRQEYINGNDGTEVETEVNVEDDELPEQDWIAIQDRIRNGQASDADLRYAYKMYKKGKYTPGKKTYDEFFSVWDKQEAEQNAKPINAPFEQVQDRFKNGMLQGIPDDVKRKAYDALLKELEGKTLEEQNAIIAKRTQEHNKRAASNMGANTIAANDEYMKDAIAAQFANANDTLIQQLGDTSNTKVAANNILQNSNSGTSTGKSGSTSTKKTETTTSDKNPSYDDIIEEDFKQGDVGYPSVYTAFKNGLFGDPDSPEAKQTFTSFLVDHIAKTFGNRNIWRYNPASKSVNMVKGEDLGGSESLFDEKIKKDWTAQIDRNNEREKDILKAKTKAITDRIDLFSGIKNNREAVDYAKQFKKLTDKDIEHALNIMDSAKINNGTFSADDFYFLSNPEKAKEWVKLMNDAKLDAAQKQNIALGLNNSILNDQAWVSKNTGAAKVIQAWGDGVLKPVSEALGEIIPD